MAIVGQIISKVTFEKYAHKKVDLKFHDPFSKKIIFFRLKEDWIMIKIQTRIQNCVYPIVFGMQMTVAYL